MITISFLNVDGNKIYYNVKGDGVPIIFIHPPLLTSANFYYQMEGLSHRFKVITFDIRGHGRSSYSEQAITYPLIVSDMKEILDHLGIKKAFIAGYSTGGSIALEFLLKYPDRAHGSIIISGMSEVSDWYTKQRIHLAIKLAKHKKTFPLLSLAISWGNANKHKMFQAMNQEALKGDNQNISQYYHYSSLYNCTDRLHEINLPVLLIYGTKNKPFHRYANLLHNRLPKSKLFFLEKEKHQLPTKAAVEINTLIDKFIHEQHK